MKFKDIEVSGISSIVFNRTWLWKRSMRRLGISDVWTCHMPGEKPITCDHDGMMRIVNKFKNEKNCRMWIHGYTLNIETPEVTGYASVSPL